MGDKTIPAYIPHVGGSYDDGEVVMGTRLKVRLPAKRVPEAVERWVRHYEANRNEGEEFNDFVERVGTSEFGVPGQATSDVADRNSAWRR